MRATNCRQLFVAVSLLLYIAITSASKMSKRDVIPECQEIVLRANCMDAACFQEVLEKCLDEKAGTDWKSQYKAIVKGQ
jgi:hypothetical protein